MKRNEFSVKSTSPSLECLTDSSMEESHGYLLGEYRRSFREDSFVMTDFSTHVDMQDISRDSLQDVRKQREGNLDETMILVTSSEQRAKRKVPRSASFDRRLNEAAQFFNAVGESPPRSQHELQRIFDDYDSEYSYDSDDAHKNRILDVEHLARDLVHRRRRRGVEPEKPSNPVWPFLQKCNIAHNLFLHLLPPARVRCQEFSYKGITSNPPEITKHGISRGNYAQLHRKAWLEVSDVERHRYGKNLRVYYRHWESLGHPFVNFFDWLDSKGEAEGQPLPDLEDCSRVHLDSDTVLYITDPRNTQGYALKIVPKPNGAGQIRNIDDEPVVTGVEGWIFVLRDNILYGAQKVTSISGNSKKRFHHSSFFGGKAVSAAGIIITDHDGVVTHILPHSGHYRPGEADLQRTLFFFYSQGVDLASFQVDTQQLIHINRDQVSSSNGYKKKKTESLHFEPAVAVAFFLSHKARCIGNGVFSEIETRRPDENGALSATLCSFVSFTL